MAETLKGLGVVWGVGGKTFTGFSTATFKTQSLGLQRTSDKAEIKDEDGEVVGQVFHNEKKVLSLSVVPSGASVAAAGTSLDNLMPSIGTTITVTDTTNATVDGSHTGKYNLLSANLRFVNDGPAVIDMEMEQYVANDVTGAIS